MDTVNACGDDELAGGTGIERERADGDRAAARTLSGSSASTAASTMAASSGARRAATPDVTMRVVWCSHAKPCRSNASKASSGIATSRVVARRRAGNGVVVMRASR